MTTNRVLTIAVIVGTLTLLVHVFRPRPQSRQPRIYMAKIRNQSDAVATQAAKYFRAACPDMLMTNLKSRGDYSVTAVWIGAPMDKEDSLNGWVVVVNRKDSDDIFFKQGSPDAIETFQTRLHRYPG